MKYTIALSLLLCTATVWAECPNGRCSPVFSSPFDSSPKVVSSRSNVNPLHRTATERTIAVNGIAVPEGAIGYRITNNELEWVFENEGSRQPQPTQGNNPQNNHGNAASSPNTRPIAPDGGNSNRAPLPKPQEFPESKNAVTRLLPANTKGNPGFPFAVKGPGFSENCQGTLISAKGGKCLVATAAHCLSDGIQRSEKKGFDREGLNHDFCTSDIRQRGIDWGTGVVDLADFGQVKAVFYVNPEYSRGTKSEDSAVFAFSCPKGAGNVPVISVGSSPLQDRENVTYGKVMGGKEGLYPGYVWRNKDIVGINFRKIGEAQESIIQPKDATIQQGDSGGGIYRGLKDGSKELVGILSTSDDVNRRWPLGNYATNRSLDFIRCLKQRFDGEKDKEPDFICEDGKCYPKEAGRPQENPATRSAASNKKLPIQYKPVLPKTPSDTKEQKSEESPLKVDHTYITEKNMMRSLDALKDLIESNQKNKVRTRVLFSSKKCPSCPARKIDFRIQAKTDPDPHVQYVIYEHEQTEVIEKWDIRYYPQERDF